jgi:hypothetical protein
VLGRDRARLQLPSGPAELSLRHSELLLLLAEAAAGGGGRTASSWPPSATPVTPRR